MQSMPQTLSHALLIFLMLHAYQTLPQALVPLQLLLRQARLQPQASVLLLLMPVPLLRRLVMILQRALLFQQQPMFNAKVLMSLKTLPGVLQVFLWHWF